MAAVEIVTQALAVAEVSSINASEIVNDTEGAWVREIHIFGPSPEGGGVAPLVLSVRLTALEKANLQFITPPLAV